MKLHQKQYYRQRYNAQAHFWHVCASARPQQSSPQSSSLHHVLPEAKYELYLLNLMMKNAYLPLPVYATKHLLAFGGGLRCQADRPAKMDFFELPRYHPEPQITCELTDRFDGHFEAHLKCSTILRPTNESQFLDRKKRCSCRGFHASGAYWPRRPATDLKLMGHSWRDISINMHFN